MTTESEITGYISLSDVKVPADFWGHMPRPRKFSRHYEHYCKFGEIEPLVLDDDSILHDGFCSYLLAKMLDVDRVEYIHMDFPDTREIPGMDIV